jgi:hypothetical protein
MPPATKEGTMDVNEQDGKLQQAKAKVDAAKDTIHEKVEAGAGRVEDVSHKTESKVATGVAAVKGVLHGLTDQMKKDDVAGTAKAAVERTGEVTREVGKAGAQETKKTKDEIGSG